MDVLRIAGREFTSRLLVGTGKYKSMDEAKAAIEASGAQIITAAVRRLNIDDIKENLLEALPPTHYTYLPNTAGCRTAEEALRAMNIAREILGTSLIKLEIMAEGVMLLPDEKETLRAATILVAEGFSVMAYTTDNLTLAGELEAAGCSAIMPLGAPIGTGLGILNPEKIRRIVAQAKVPVLVDAGVGTASDAALAMELGCDGVLLNTAIAEAENPVRMAESMKHAVIAGRLAYLAGRMPKRETANPSSPPKDLH